MNFVKSSLFNFITSSLLYIIHVATSIVQARVLGPSELGRYQLLVSTQTILVATLSFGLGQAGIYFRNSQKIGLEKIISTLLKAESVISLLGSVILFGVIWANQSYFGTFPLYVIVLYAIGSGMSLVCSSLSPLLIADMQIVRLQKTRYTSSVLIFVALIVLYYSEGTLSVNMLVILTSLAYILSAVLLLYYFLPHFDIRRTFDGNLFKRIATFGMKMSFNNVAFLFIQNAPVYMLSWLVVTSLSDVGLYTRAVAVCGMATFLNSTIGPLLYSKLSSINNDQKVEYTKLIASALLTVNLLMTLFVMLFSPLLIYILYGEEYIGAAPLLRMLSLTLIVTGTNELMNSLLSSIGKPQYLLRNFIATLIILIPLLYIFINVYGLMGCAVAVLIATYLKTLLMIRSARRFLPIKYYDFFAISKNTIVELTQLVRNNLQNK